MKMSEFEPVKKAKHYESHESGVSCKELLDFLNCNVGLALKYVWRYQDKGTPLQDLQKARFYLRRHLRNPWAPVFVYVQAGNATFARSVESLMSESRSQFYGYASKVIYTPVTRAGGGDRRQGLLSDFLDQLSDGNVAKALDCVEAMIAALEP